MSADPNTPPDPEATTGGFVLKNMIYDGSSKGSLEVIAHWRAYEGTRHVDQYNVPPYKPLMGRTHPCFPSNRALGDCQDRLDPEMLLAGRCAACFIERQALMKCLVKVRKMEREADKTKAPIVVESAADKEGTWAEWLRSLGAGK